MAIETNEEKTVEQKKVKKKKITFPMIFTLFLLTVFAVEAILALTLETNLGNIMLLITGAVDLLLAFILYRIMDFRQKKICPVCGTTRTYHRTYLRTDESGQNTTSNGVRAIRTNYTHRYEDTYVCENCGEMMQVEGKSDGGWIIEDTYGNILVDHRISPKSC